MTLPKSLNYNIRLSLSNTRFYINITYGSLTDYCDVPIKYENDFISEHQCKLFIEDFLKET